MFIVVAVVVWLCRLPLFAFQLAALSYGPSADAWRIANAGRAIALSHHYVAARLPGNPLHEFVAAGLWRGGPTLLNMATMVMSALGVAFGAALKC